jgi:hypothetical protein
MEGSLDLGPLLLNVGPLLSLNLSASDSATPSPLIQCVIVPLGVSHRQIGCCGCGMFTTISSEME